MPISAVGYCRVSTERQAEEGVSLNAQRARIEAYSAARDLQLVAVYDDAGISGRRTANRPGLDSALRHVCEAHAVLVVHSLSRLARSTRDAIMLSERLSRSNAELVSLSESIDTTSATGRMFFRILSVLAEFESDQISERVQTALDHKKQNGERYCLHAPYGYRFEDGALHPDADEQVVLRRMRLLRRSGSSYAAIARSLTTRGVRSRTGKHFTGERVRRILSRTAPASVEEPRSHALPDGPDSTRLSRHRATC